MKKIGLILAVLALVLTASPVSAKGQYAPQGIFNKFESFRSCFGIPLVGSCHQFNYFNDGIVGFTEFGKFMQKYTRMVK